MRTDDSADRQSACQNNRYPETIKMTNPEPLSERPCQTPVPGGSNRGVRAVRAAYVGFASSLLGVLGVCVAGWSSVGAWLALFSVPGLAVSVYCFSRHSQRISAWGTALGLLGTLYVPTMLRALFFSKTG